MDEEVFIQYVTFIKQVLNNYQTFGKKLFSSIFAV